MTKCTISQKRELVHYENLQEKRELHSYIAYLRDDFISREVWEEFGQKPMRRQRVLKREEKAYTQNVTLKWAVYSIN